MTLRQSEPDLPLGHVSARVDWRASRLGGFSAAVLCLFASWATAFYVEQIGPLGGHLRRGRDRVVFLIWLSWNVNAIFFGGALATEVEIAIDAYAAIARAEFDARGAQAYGFATRKLKPPADVVTAENLSSDLGAKCGTSECAPWGRRRAARHPRAGRGGRQGLYPGAVSAPGTGGRRASTEDLFGGHGAAYNAEGPDPSGSHRASDEEAVARFQCWARRKAAIELAGGETAAVLAMSRPGSRALTSSAGARCASTSWPASRGGAASRRCCGGRLDGLRAARLSRPQAAITAPAARRAGEKWGPCHAHLTPAYLHPLAPPAA